MPALPLRARPSRPWRTSFALLLAGLVGLGAASGCERSDDTAGSGGSAAGVGGGGGSGGTLEARKLQILTWNLHNFVNDDIDDTDAPFEVTDPNWDSHRQDVGEALLGFDADILVLQEVEHEEVLKQLNDFELAGAYPHIRVIDGNDPRGIDVGVMSKLPLDEVISHKDEQFALIGTSAPSYRYARDCLEVRLTYNERPIVLLGVHYKSKDNDDPDKRLAEAQHTRQLANFISSNDPETAIVILGDFNDLPGSAAYTFTEGEAPDQYTNAADAVDIEDRWTFLFQGAFELVDQQMMNPRMADLLDQNDVNIPHDMLTEDASDHAPVIATYWIK